MIASAARFVERAALSGLPRRSTCTPPASGCRCAAMTTVVLYGREGCCLCDEAREMLLRIRAAQPFELQERDIESDDALLARLPGADPGDRDRRRGGVRAVCRRAELRAAGSSSGSAKWGPDELHRRPRRSSRLSRRGQAGGEALARRRRAAVALPAGAHPGPQDGQGDDLLTGARRLHARELDPDPPRPVGVRQVRQARRRLQRRVAGHPDPQDPAHLGPAQHRAVRRRPPRHGDRDLGHLRRPRLPGGGGVRRRRGQGRHPDRHAHRPAQSTNAPGDRGRGHRRRGARRAVRRRPGARRRARRRRA